VLAGNDLYGGTASISRLATISSANLDTIAAVNACETQGCASSEANLNAAAGFVQPREDPRLGDWHVRANSPCVGAGVDPGVQDLLGLFRIDLDGDLRPLGSALDCGADER
jgi:hypothetical protein